MSKGNIILALVVVSVLVAGSGYYIYTKMFPPKPVHYHAGFKVFVDDQLQDFSSIKYMTISPCTDTGKAKTGPISAAEAQNNKGHLHENIGDVVHVHATGGTWGDLFQNIHYTFPAGKPIFAFINGKVVEDILHTPIRPYDSIEIFVGKRDKMQEELKQAVTLEHIKQVEQMSELCAGSS